MTTIIEYYNNNQTYITFNNTIDISIEIMEYITNKLTNETYTNIINKNIYEIVNNGKYLVINNDVVTFVENKNIIYKWKIISENPIQLYPKFNNINKNSKILIVCKNHKNRIKIIKNILDNFDDNFVSNSYIIDNDVSKDNYDNFDMKYLCGDDKNLENHIDNIMKDKNDFAIIANSCLHPNNVIKFLTLNKLVTFPSIYPMSNCRSFDIIFYGYDGNIANQARIYEMMKLDNPFSKQNFKETFETITNNNRFMVNDNGMLCYYC